ncbi:hypothetical protein [Virgibacillus necropolis]|uniref:Uncharacterized protein n=1 Tax=Virgibacillus necropolis TaxID=163877 RepID=A0A221MGH8_9BACI|nr:hypothetical protein [Virgibacillus necropolis]ASN06756.1 hypothetical protein CFK40_17895 [Virgibacillus necropolis]
MGLFINNSRHVDLFKNEGNIDEPNQSYFKRDHFEELVKGQLKVNESLNHSIHGLKSLYEQQEFAQSNKWKEVSNSLNELKISNVQQEKDQRFVVDRLKRLENENKKLQVIMEDERLSEQEMMDQVNNLSQSNQEVMDQLEAYCLENEAFKSKVDEQYDFQKELSDQIKKQENAQDEVLSRLENQEALTEKVTRQIEYFRSILFERTNYLAEKIENGYHNTSSYIANLISSSDQTPKRFLVNQKQAEDQKINK